MGWPLRVHKWRRDLGYQLPSRSKGVVQNTYLLELLGGLKEVTEEKHWAQVAAPSTCALLSFPWTLPPLESVGWGWGGMSGEKAQDPWLLIARQVLWKWLGCRFCLCQTFKITLNLCFPSSVGSCNLQLTKFLCLQEFLIYSRLDVVMHMFPQSNYGEEYDAARLLFWDGNFAWRLSLPLIMYFCSLGSFFMGIEGVYESSVI